MPDCVVSDTSSLSAMAKMDWLLWLKERWGTVLVPLGVWVELEQIGDEEAWHRLESARDQGWLLVMLE
jgi:predicted nucleic acid-binding protein